MDKYFRHICHTGTTILEAFSQMNRLGKNLTLFITNSNNKLLGTLTDGDIRRGLLSGKSLEDPVEHFMLTDFHSLNGEMEVHYIKELKTKGVELLPLLNSDGNIIKIYNLNYLNTILPVHAVIMAGGKGERLRPLTDNVPKPMLKLGEKPLIQITVEWLEKFGIDNISVSVSYLAEQITNHFASYRGSKIDFIKEDKPLGTIGSLTIKEDYIHDYILLTNADLFTNIDYEDLFTNFIDENADMAVATIPYTVKIPYAIFEKDKKLIKGYQEKPNNTYYANAGIYLLKKEFINLIPNDTLFNATDLIDIFLQQSLKVIHNPIVGYWIDIGRIEDYQKAKEIHRHLSYYNK